MNTFDVLAAAVEKVSDFEGEITESITLPELMLASLDYISIQLDVKRNLGVDIEYDDFASGTIQTVGDFVRYIDERRTLPS